MMRYLQHDAIRGKGLAHFDCWASTFGETQTAIELAPEGTGYRARTRFAKFFNLPELMTLFKEAADIKTSDQLNLPTPTPIYHNEVAQPTEIQKQMVQELSERAARVHAQLVDPGTDNMLKITSDGRKLGLDQRIINPDLPDDPNSKVNRCVDNIHRIWQDGQADRLTQLVFCDLSTPKTGATGAKAAKTAGGNLDSPELHALEAVIGQDAADEPGFTVYDDIREKLVARGIPREQIAFIHEANTETRKKELFAKVRSGQVRVLMGSTFKMGAGMNVQDRLVALHDLDCPWRPGDLEQRSGRIIRQGNRNKEVHIYRYVTEDVYKRQVQEIAVQEPEPVTAPDNGCVPDPAISVESMNAYGYTDSNMLPLTKERALELMERDVSVYMLHTDNTEAMAFDTEDIRSFDGIFGVEATEWETVKDRFTPPDYEKAFLSNPADSFAIYQLRDNDNTAQLRFMNAEYLEKKGLSIEKGNYAAVYAGNLDRRGDTQDRLDELYETFNLRRPEDFRGHSLSVSDIVALKQNGVVSCHYVDSRGFKALPDFLKPENYLKNAEMAMEDDYGMIDGVINNGPKQTVAELEEQAKSGKPVSLMELAQAARREQAQAARQEKKPSVLAKLCPPVNEPKKTARSKRAERELL